MSAPASPYVKMPHKTVMVIFFGLMMALFLASIDQTIISTALPTIAGDLGGVDHVAWIITAYTLAITIGMPIYGKLGDQFGHKGLFVAAIIIFLIGSVLGGLATTMEFLIVGRFIQGLGAAGLMILAQAILADIMSPLERAKYSGLMGAVFGVSAIGGPLLGGFLTEHLSWHWTFWINIPLGIITLFVIVKTLHLPHTVSSHKIDYWGMSVMIPATTVLVLIATWGGTQYKWSSPEIIGLIIAFCVLTAIFIAIEHKASEPIIPLKLFKSKTFTLAALVGLTLGAGTFAALSYLPTYLQMVSGVSATNSGLLMLPMMGSMFVSSIASGFIIAKTGKFKIFPILGTAFSTLGLYLLSTMDTNTHQIITSLYMIIVGFGMGLCMQTMILIVQNAVAAKDVGAATASNNFFREIGISLGVAVFGSVFASRLNNNIHGISGGHPESVEGLNPATVHSLPDEIKSPIIEAYVSALTPAFVYLVPIVFLGLIAALFLPPMKLSQVSGLERKHHEMIESNELGIHTPEDYRKGANVPPVSSDPKPSRDE